MYGGRVQPITCRRPKNREACTIEKIRSKANELNYYRAPGKTDPPVIAGQIIYLFE